MRPHLAILLAVAAACGGGSKGGDDDGDDDAPTEEARYPLSNRLDLMFVVDDSLTMADEQAALIAAVPDLLAALASEDGGLPDLHVGVVSSSMGTGENATTCADHEGAWLQGEFGTCLDGVSEYLTTEPANFLGTLGSEVACLLDVGTSGCGFEQHLEAMRTALARDDGFVRPGVPLAVVIIADEDDCSARPTKETDFFDPTQDSADAELGFFDGWRCWEFGVVCNGDDPEPRDMPHDGTTSVPGTSSPREDCAPREDSEYLEPVGGYVDALRELKPDGDVFVAVITGDDTPIAVREIDSDGDLVVDRALVPSCESTTYGEVAPATRLAALAAAFDDRGRHLGLCDAEDGLAADAEALGAALRRDAGGPACLVGAVRDVDADAVGIQPACEVEDELDDAVRRIPACADSGGALPCFTIGTDEACDGDARPSGLTVEVDYGDGAPDPGTTRVVRCEVE
jgi:hypothetical protein